MLLIVMDGKYLLANEKIELSLIQDDYIKPWQTVIGYELKFMQDKKNKLLHVPHKNLHISQALAHNHNR
ncbi:hypothetical protein ABER23_05925 [Paenibacillus lautus]|uniref:Uncharacterized protein n=1 Tax=Paenibacillus lautus TaxID=1401 RepID=A0A1R1AXM5_PAELA|nr:hypothetical protein BK123_19870 [Paenibacillus lautus]